jgi:hypothetical protein
MAAAAVGAGACFWQPAAAIHNNTNQPALWIFVRFSTHFSFAGLGDDFLRVLIANWRPRSGALKLKFTWKRGAMAQVPFHCGAQPLVRLKLLALRPLDIRLAAALVRRKIYANNRRNVTVGTPVAPVTPFLPRIHFICRG